jgi:hypothetical protein
MLGKFLSARSSSVLVAAATAALSVFCVTATAETITFDSLHGPTLFGSSLQNLTIPTSIGLVKVTGGMVLTDEANLPADTTSVYGSIGFSDGSEPFLDPITITFPVAVTNFFLNVYNGDTAPVDFLVADNAGHSQMFDLPDNFSSGESLVGIPATGNIVTIFANPLADDPIWDFSIDNITFNQPLPKVPEPTAVALCGMAFLALGGLAYRRRMSNGRSKDRN